MCWLRSSCLWVLKVRPCRVASDTCHGCSISSHMSRIPRLLPPVPTAPSVAPYFSCRRWCTSCMAWARQPSWRTAVRAWPPTPVPTLRRRPRRSTPAKQTCSSACCSAAARLTRAERFEGSPKPCIGHSEGPAAWVRPPVAAWAARLSCCSVQAAPTQARRPLADGARQQLVCLVQRCACVPASPCRACVCMPPIAFSRGVAGPRYSGC